MIKNKAIFYRLFYKGKFGNYSPMWQSYEDWERSRYPGLVAIRSLKPGGRCVYLIPPHKVKKYISQWVGPYNISAQCPEKDKIIQGETDGYNGFFSKGPEPMREALRKSGYHTTGLRTHLTLKHSMCSNSWEWYNELLILYPGHIIEFTCLRYPWGMLPHHNTLFWEVRAY